MCCDLNKVATSSSDTIKCFGQAQTSSISNNNISFWVNALKASKSISQIRSIHARTIENGDASDIRIASTLIRMYAKFGSMPESRQVFDNLHHRDVVSWTAIILGYAENKQGEGSLALFLQMHRSGCDPNLRTFTAVIKACTVLASDESGVQIDGKMAKIKALEKGMSIHSRILGSGDGFLETTLIEMYSKCRSIADARRVFDRARNRDVVIWTALMIGYVENEQFDSALDLLQEMHRDGCDPNSRSYVAAIKACSGLAAWEQAREIDGFWIKAAALEKGMALHREVEGLRIKNSVGGGGIYLANILISMYSSCGSMIDARSVFDKIDRRDVISWTALLSGYAQNRDGGAALEMFSAMDSLPDARTFVALMKACVDLAGREDPVRIGEMLVKMLALETGMAIQSFAMNSGCKFDIFLENTLIDMYSNCGSLIDAKLVFAKIQRRDVVSWNALMLGYAQNAESETALELFLLMQWEGFSPNGRSFLAAVKACIGQALTEEATKVNGTLTKIAALEKGMYVHSEFAKRSFNSDVFVSASLIDLYSKCGSMIDAAAVFDKMDRPGVVPWTSLILGYVENGKPDLALELFVAMEAENCEPNSQTFAAAFKACGSIAEMEEFSELGQGKMVKRISLEKAFALHSRAARICSRETFVDGTALIEMYTKCGSSIDARRAFDDPRCRKTPSYWSALLIGCARNGELDDAMELLPKMSWSCGDARTLSAALKACSSVGAWQPGRRTHAEIIRSGLEIDQVAATCLVDFYSKVGSMIDAQIVSDSMISKDLVAWTALIAGYGRQGDSQSLFRAFHSLEDLGLRPDSLTFLSIISACSYAGLVDQGKNCLAAMETKYGIAPGCEHYHGVIDLLGRANHLDEAVKLAKSMPFEPSYVTWTTILSSSKKWKNDRVGRIAFEAMVELDEGRETAYLLMAGLYGSLGRNDDKAMVLARRKSNINGQI